MDGCLVISNHFPCKDLVHHPIDGQPLKNWLALEFQAGNKKFKRKKFLRKIFSRKKTAEIWSSIPSDSKFPHESWPFGSFERPWKTSNYGGGRRVHPWRLTWNIIMEVWKIIFLSKWVICRFHVNLPGCMKVAEWPGVLGSVKFFGRPGCLVSNWSYAFSKRQDRLTPWPLGRGDYICPILEEMKLDAQNVAGHSEWFPASKIIFFFLGGRLISHFMTPDNQNRSEVCFPAWFPTPKNHQDLCRMSISGWNSGSFRMSPCCFLDDSRPLLVHPTVHLRARRNASWQPQARMATRRRTPFGAKPTAKGGFFWFESSWDVVLLSFLFC